MPATATPKRRNKTKSAASTKPAAPKAASKAKPASRKAEPRKADTKPRIVVPTRDEIAMRAYQIWLEKGQPFGRDEENWIQAVNDLTTAA